MAGSRYRRRYRRRRSRKTTSAYVTLTQNAGWILFEDYAGVRKWKAFTFSPATVPGFMDYQATYSHFRILKCKLYMARSFGNETGANYNYLTVGSRPFAAVQAPGNQSSGPEALVPPQLETDLRQAKWQKIRNPSTISQVVPIGFHPYTMIQTNGPSTLDCPIACGNASGKPSDGCHSPGPRPRMADRGPRRHSLLRPICSRRRVQGRHP